MLILFDHGVPIGVASALAGHTVIRAQDRGWDQFVNGRLLDAAEAAVCDVLVTTDRRIRFQHNLAERKIALVVITGTTKWSRVRLHLKRISAAVSAASPGSYFEVEIPPQ